MIKWDFLVMSVILLGMSTLCYWMTRNMVMTSSDKDVLQMCMWATGLLGSFSLGLALSKMWRRE